MAQEGPFLAKSTQRSEAGEAHSTRSKGRWPRMVTRFPQHQDVALAMLNAEELERSRHRHLSSLRIAAGIKHALASSSTPERRRWRTLRHSRGQQGHGRYSKRHRNKPSSS